MSVSPVTCTVDLSVPGRNLGYLQVPHSVHRSAYGHIPVPVASIVGEEAGPSVLLIAGNHGDEYEGQVILSELIRTLDPIEINGRITILPMANFPAAQEGLRTSPLDGGNLNRSFPGTPRGMPTPMIAHYIESVLMANVDLSIDLHSGGSSLYCMPFIMTAWQDGNPRNALRRAVIDAFGLPVSLLHGTEEDGWYSSSAGWRAGAASFTLELGGAGTVDPVIRYGAQAGLMRALQAAGAFLGDCDPMTLSETCREVRQEHLVFADEPGLYEPLARAGEDVTAGYPAARIHFPETPGKEPLYLEFDRDALILAHRVPARVIRGDCLFHLAY